MLKELLFGITPVSSPFLEKDEGSKPEYLKRRSAPPSTSEATTYFRAMERSSTPPSSFLLRDLRRTGGPFNPTSSV